jgi:hypothetical protein
MRAVICDGHLTGSIASFPAEGRTEVTYWIDRAAWGRGIATRALALGRMPRSYSPLRKVVLPHEQSG